MTDLQLKRKAVFIELHSLGITQKRVGALIGMHVSNVSTYAKIYGLTFRRETGGFAVWTEAARARSVTMAALYRNGYTLEQIGQQYGITRERVRQLITKYHGLTASDGGRHFKAGMNAARRANALDAKCMAKFGCPYAQYAIIRDLKKPTRAYCSQRENAAKRGIGWELTLWQWWCIWQLSGHWHERGRGQGYCMARKGDTGPYAVGNVSIITIAQNSSEGTKRENGLPIGVIKNKSGTYRAQRHINGKAFYLGSHSTPELAHAAYLSAGAA